MILQELQEEGVQVRCDLEEAQIAVAVVKVDGNSAKLFAPGIRERGEVGIILEG